jgi:hypothetical protein
LIPLKREYRDRNHCKLWSQCYYRRSFRVFCLLPEPNLRRLLLISALVIAGFVQASLAKHVTLRGFVTAVHSPTSFEMDEYKIIDDTEAEHRRLGSVGKKDWQSPQLKPGTLRVGLEVEVKGDYDRKTGEVKATGIKALSDDTDPATPVEGMGLVEDKTSLQKTAQGWSGRLVAEGETLAVTPDTLISVKRSRAERKELRNAGLGSNDDSAFSPDDIDLDTFAHYVGLRQKDHSILAKKIEFRQDRAAAESDWSLLAAKVFYPEANSDVGTLTVDEKEYELFPSPEAEEYLGKLGASLIPAHERELPDKSASRVLFRFFLVNTDTVDVDTYPNGVVVVSAHVFDVFDNEAQLAFVLAHEMATAVEKHVWIITKYCEKERIEMSAVGAAASLAFPGALIATSLADKSILHNITRSLHNQADRVGIEYMLAAGYDPGQAVESWRVLEKKRAQGRFWGNHGVNFERRTYLESELRLSYANRDFSSLKRDSSGFHAAADAVEAARRRIRTKSK